MKPLIAAALILAALLTATHAYAVSTTFNIFLDENDISGGVFEHADWTGTYRITDGVLTDFEIVIGDCNTVLFCTYNNELAFHANPDPGGPIDGNLTSGVVSAYPNNPFLYIPGVRFWITVNDADSGFLRQGVYRVEADAATVPEPASAVMMLLGSLGLWIRRQFA